MQLAPAVEAAPLSGRLLPRALVHRRSAEIAALPAVHDAALSRLLGEQRRICHFLARAATGTDGKEILGRAQWYVAAVLRVFELTGGRMRSGTWEQIHAAEAAIRPELETLLPHDAGFAGRLRAVAWRAQPHVLDELHRAVFELPTEDGEVDLAVRSRVELFLMLWVAVEVIDASWTPPAGFRGDTEYRFCPVDDPGGEA